MQQLILFTASFLLIYPIRQSGAVALAAIHEQWRAWISTGKRAQKKPLNRGF
ncbi:hypothetical protein [Polaromonas sp. DSR2-3-2]|uniref:hypothetical protein n=1 Tax=unclassified Polaromonas TaxID=2638319 RepID=UPI003CE750D9